MGDLISRREVMKFLCEKNKNGMPESPRGMVVYCFIENLIDEIRDDIPTAYDLNKVVKQLEESSYFSEDSNCNIVEYQRAIEIVKGAVNNE